MVFFCFCVTVLSSGTNGVNIPPDSAATSESPSDATLKSSDSEDKVSWRKRLKVADINILGNKAGKTDKDRFHYAKRNCVNAEALFWEGTEVVKALQIKIRGEANKREMKVNLHQALGCLLSLLVGF